MTAIRDSVDGIDADGGTAIYSALAQAYDVVARAQASDPDRLYSIVLMTDGENNSRHRARPVRAPEYAPCRGRSATSTRTRSCSATANKDEMQHDRRPDRRGRLRRARPRRSQTIFKQIRGYQ